MAGEKSTTQIWMDFAKARQQADSLEQTAKAIRKESARFGECRNEVSQAWTGDSARNFTGKMGMVSEDLNKIAGELEQAASVIRQSAKRIYDAEMEAKRIAEARKV